MASENYDYELRRGEAIVATGQLALASPPVVGERMTIGRQTGIVRDVLPPLGKRGRIVVQLLPA